MSALYDWWGSYTDWGSHRILFSMDVDQEFISISSSWMWLVHSHEAEFMCEGEKGIITSSCVFRKKLIVTNRMLLIWISTSAHFVFKSVFCVFYLCIFFFFLVFSCEAALKALYKKESLLLLVVCVSKKCICYSCSCANSMFLIRPNNSRASGPQKWLCVCLTII